MTRTLPVDRTPAAASSYEMAPTRSAEQRTSTLRHRAVSGAVPEAR
ncbi:hypothetical protein QJS66_12475 [Kocuria rhizophila]|nr:hypothetical protein QJS66_12475 [Kocuria rhizophila]